jgi:hypothetical protein
MHIPIVDDHTGPPGAHAPCTDIQCATPHISKWRVFCQYSLTTDDQLSESC